MKGDFDPVLYLLLDYASRVCVFRCFLLAAFDIRLPCPKMLQN